MQVSSDRHKIIELVMEITRLLGLMSVTTDKEECRKLKALIDNAHNELARIRAASKNEDITKRIQGDTP